MLGQAWLFSVSVTYDHLRIHLKIQILILALGRGWKPENLIFLHIPSWCCWSEGYTLRGKDLCTIDLKGMILFKWSRDTAGAKEQGVLAVLNWTPDIYMCHFSCVWLFATPWTVARQAPPSTGILQAQALLQGIIRVTQETSPNLLCLLALAGGFFITSATCEAPSHLSKCNQFQNLLLIFLLFSPFLSFFVSSDFSNSQPPSPFSTSFFYI